MTTFSDDDDHCQADNMIDNSIQLGFLNEIDNNSNNSDKIIKNNDGIFSNSDWSAWDGGIVGGKPCWLNPANPLSYNEILCNKCEEPMIHLLHLYCPLDDPEHAFHRTLYLFCCQKPLCISSGNVKCFRYQLPRNNPYFPYHSEDGPIIDTSYKTKEEISANHPYHSRMTQLCVVCGCQGDKRCGSCGEVSYCSRAHQKFHWKIGGHNKQCGGNNNAIDIDIVHDDNNNLESVKVNVDTKDIKSGIIFPQYEIMVMEEELDENLATPIDIPLPVSKTVVTESTSFADNEDDDDKAIREEFEKVARRSGQEVPTNNHVDGEDDEGGEGDGEDEIYQEFTKRVRMGGAAQVLRYSRWNPQGHLLMHKQAYSNSDTNNSTIDNAEEMQMQMQIDKLVSIPCCENCGSPRQIEFQVMPQLIHFIDKKGVTRTTRSGSKAYDKEDEEDKEKLIEDTDLDWGTLDVWTCTNSCNTYMECKNEKPKAFLKEVVTLQKPLPHARDTTTLSPVYSKGDPNQHILT